MADPVDQLQSLYLQLQEAQESRDRSAVSRLSSELLSEISKLPPLEHLNKNQRARALLYKGKALSTEDKYNREAEEALTRSVKLDPSNPEGWIWLGEIFYLKQDYVQSKRCFEGSIENYTENKLALRKLSMISRLLEDGYERKRAVQESVELAKRAVGLDFKDGYSWYVLGNAHLTNFFMNCPGSDELKKALNAYAQAEKLLKSPEPDLHYNRGEALKFLERYQEALNDFSVAHSLDNELGGDSQALTIVEKVKDIAFKIHSKNGFKRKDVHSLVKTIPHKMPVRGGYEHASIRKLTAGANDRKILPCKIISAVSENLNEVPAIFVACDSEGEFFSLSVYNTNPYIHQNITFNAAVFIRDPVLTGVHLTVQDTALEYKGIRVIEPSTIVVNEKNIYEAFSPSSVVNLPII